FFESVESSARVVPTSSAASTPQRPTTPLQPPPSQQLIPAGDSRGQKRNSSRQCVVTRSKAQQDLCHQRDQRKCILTKSGKPNKSKERVDAWYNTIFPLGIEERAYFALKPIRMSDNKKRLARLFNHETCAKISSRCEISLKTDNPDMYTEDDWDIDIAEGPATYLEEHFPAQLPGIQRSGHMITLRGGGGSGEGEEYKES
ncbi:hypothetical protein K469DRAFT_721301, partial [Zopfia rhizophila CBS 207.26]